MKNEKQNQTIKIALINGLERLGLSQTVFKILNLKLTRQQEENQFSFFKKLDSEVKNGFIKLDLGDWRSYLFKSQTYFRDFQDIEIVVLNFALEEYTILIRRFISFIISSIGLYSFFQIGSFPQEMIETNWEKVKTHFNKDNNSPRKKNSTGKRGMKYRSFLTPWITYHDFKQFDKKLMPITLSKFFFAGEKIDYEHFMNEQFREDISKKVKQEILKCKQIKELKIKNSSDFRVSLLVRDYALFLFYSEQRILNLKRQNNESERDATIEFRTIGTSYYTFPKIYQLIKFIYV